MRIDSHSMDIDSWSCEMRARSDNAMSYRSGDQPPSLGDVRQMVVSEPSGSNQMCSDGQPPSVNDVGRREPSQSEPCATSITMRVLMSMKFSSLAFRTVSCRGEARY